MDQPWGCLRDEYVSLTAGWNLGENHEIRIEIWERNMKLKLEFGGELSKLKLENNRRIADKSCWLM